MFEAQRKCWFSLEFCGISGGAVAACLGIGEGCPCFPFLLLTPSLIQPAIHSSAVSAVPRYRCNGTEHIIELFLCSLASNTQNSGFFCLIVCLFLRRKRKKKPVPLHNAF